MALLLLRLVPGCSVELGRKPGGSFEKVPAEYDAENM